LLTAAGQVDILLVELKGDDKSTK